MQEIRALTSLRFLAAFYVFIFHMNIHFGVLDGPKFTNRLIGQGAVGMTLFFMLSGFVLAASYGASPTSAVEFYKRRAARILPVYWLSALLTAPFMFVLSEPEVYHGIKTVGFVLLSHALLMQAWFRELFNVWNFGGSWSLSAEAFFYALFPIVLACLKDLRPRQLLTFTLVCYGASVLPGLAHSSLGGGGGVYYSVPIYRLPEFSAGCGLGLTYLKGLRLPRPGMVVLGSLVATLLILGLTKPRIYVDMNWAVVPCFGILLVGCAGLTKCRLRSILECRALVFLGRISYSFYLIQTSVVILLLVLKVNNAWAWLFASRPVLFGLTSIVILVGSTLAYLFVEEPMRRVFSSRHQGQT